MQGFDSVTGKLLYAFLLGKSRSNSEEERMKLKLKFCGVIKKEYEDLRLVLDSPESLSIED